MFLEENYIMWLARIDGISLRKKEEILKHFGNAEALFRASSTSVKNYCEKYRINFSNIIETREDDVLNRYLDELYKNDIKYVIKTSDDYPELLKNISDAPLGFYMIGTMPDDNNKVAIIGARKCTQYGAMNAYRFGKELAENDIPVISGMALGIDSMAHKGAIDGKGKTVAVLGCGVDIVYPPSNMGLRESIIKNGCVISEYPPQTPPYPANFPPRNRIISGLSDAIIVVESAKRSGTLITVGQALEQGRDVFAIPGNINNPMSQGTNDLIKDSAHPLTNIDDVLSVVGVLHKFSERNSEDVKINKIVKKEKYIIEPDEKIVYNCIENVPISIDEIISNTNLSIQKIQYTLTMLEIKGCIKKLAGQKYVREL